MELVIYIVDFSLRQKSALSLSLLQIDSHLKSTVKMAHINPNESTSTEDAFIKRVRIKNSEEERLEPGTNE